MTWLNLDARGVATGGARRDKIPLEIRMLIPPDYTIAMARGVVGAFGGMEDATDVQRRFGRALFDLNVDSAGAEELLAPLDPEGLAEAIPGVAERNTFMNILAIFELMARPVPKNLERNTERYGLALGVSPPLLGAVRHLTGEHYALAYLDLARHSWYVKRTLNDSAHGRLYELLRSELAYLGLADKGIAAKWRALGDLPDGTWGKEVDNFYEDRGFPRPGEAHGIYELGARHDWIHVLADYDTDPIGELEVFGLISAGMAEPRGFTMLAVTLGIYQTGTITHMHGKRVMTATSDALDAPDAAERFARAMVRGANCPIDMMDDVDFFAMADRPLDQVRAEFKLDATIQTGGVKASDESIETGE